MLLLKPFSQKLSSCFMSLCVCVYNKKCILSLNESAWMSMSMSLWTIPWATHQCLQHCKAVTFLYPSTTIDRRLFKEDEGFKNPSLFHDELGKEPTLGSCTDNHSCNDFESALLMSNPEESSTPLTLKIFWPLFNNIPWALSVFMNIDVFFKVQLFTVTYSLHFKLLRISAAVQCKKLIWYELRATVMYTYKDQYL